MAKDKKPTPEDKMPGTPKGKGPIRKRGNGKNC